jgi:branched-chain amino acid transport system substrate-binding protein
MLAGCSLGTVPRASCDAQSCQANFGFGYVCAADGFCEQVAPSNRCTKTFPVDLFARPDNYRDITVIGNLMDRSLTTHAARENSAQIAAEAANLDAAHPTFGIVYCTIQQDPSLDARTQQQAAVDSALFLAQRMRLPAIVGPASSGDTQAVFLALRDAGLDTLVISPSATSTELIDIDQPNPTDATPGLLWRTAPPDTFQSRKIVEDMMTRSITNVRVIHTTDAYGQSLATAFAAAFPGSAMLFPLASSTAIAEEAVGAASSTAQEVLFIGQTADAAAFITATIGLSGFDTKTIFLTDTAANSDFLTGTATATTRYPQIRGTRPALPSGSTYLVFQSSYRSRFGGDDPALYTFTANAYDAAFLVFYGIEWALAREGGVLNGTNIARGLRRVSSGSPLDLVGSTFDDAIRAFEIGSSVDVNGASGTLNYDRFEETEGVIEIWTPAALMMP